MSGAPLYLRHPSSLEHDTGPHPEQPARIIAIEQALAERGWCGYVRGLSEPVSDGDLEAVHPSAHVAAIERAAAMGGAQLDMDTVVSPGSYAAARHAAGGGVALVDALLDGSAPTGISVHRPPGHHATADRAMGFCLFNNVAVAARHAVRVGGLERVLVLDWDVHHGNGTAEIFAADPEVLFVSIHEWPLYPGTGAQAETGDGPGEGFTVNLPVPAGSGDAVFGSLVEHVGMALARAWQPQLLLVSAGFDAHREDPLAGCAVTDGGFATMARSVARAARELGVPAGAVLEGGYALGALARSVAAVLPVLADPDVGDGVETTELAVHPLAEAARRRLAAERWPGLA